MRERSGVAALAMMAGAGLAFGAPGAAEAEFHNFNVEATGGTLTQTLSFASFDTSLGTLTEVDILLSNSVESFGSTANITGGEGGVTATASLTANLDITGPGVVTPLFTGAAASSATCTNTLNGSSCFQFDSVSLAGGAFTPDPVQLTSNLSPWETGANVSVPVAIDNYAPLTSCPSQDTCANTNNLGWTGTVTVTYQYDASNVPEPASLLVLGAGLLGLAVTRRRTLRLRAP
jgi:hypothetical protein